MSMICQAMGWEVSDMDLDLENEALSSSEVNKKVNNDIMPPFHEP
jgi:hypothetical protein